MHCSPRFGATERGIEQEGVPVAERLPWLAGEDPSAQQQAGAALTMVGDALARQSPDALMLVGDRLETAAAALAATLQGVPIVHLHGGEETEGAFDNALRHAITKMSHLHLVSHPLHARRVVAMGEDPAAVHVVGAPGLDNAHRDDLPAAAELEQRLGLRLTPPVVLVTLHPSTLGGQPEAEAAALAASMDEVEATYLVSLPNSDPGSEILREALRRAGSRPRRAVAEALGERFYWGLMRQASAILGNSSSALIEAPLLGLPAVNLGHRQKGRLRGRNVIDVPFEASRIAAALRQALDPRFRAGLAGETGPYGDGRSAERIVRILRAWTPPRPAIKRLAEDRP
jgi:UDP-hydrolysing UDP-N-acetyl-D-glucosamine 2-epimerase